MSPTAGEFQGTVRFQPMGTLGQGAMGIVYRVWDAELGCEVALKTVPELSPEEIYGLKHEFRVLADLSHPNPVTLHELTVDGRQCFFTMEPIDGVDFLRHVRARHASLVQVVGPSGIGKTEMIARFLDSIGPGDALVLRGRCLTRESVPYKAFDAAVDALSRLLAGRPPEALARVVPGSIGALARLFPALEQWSGWARDRATHRACRPRHRRPGAPPRHPPRAWALPADDQRGRRAGTPALPRPDLRGGGGAAR